MKVAAAIGIRPSFVLEMQDRDVNLGVRADGAVGQIPGRWPAGNLPDRWGGKEAGGIARILLGARSRPSPGSAS